MKKLIYTAILMAMFPGLYGQFSGILNKEGFTRLENDSVILIPAENLKGTFQWQKSSDSLSWTEIEANEAGNTLAFVPEQSEAYRLQITGGTCPPVVYSDTVKVFSQHTTLSEYLQAGVHMPDLVDNGITVDDLLAEGLSITDLLNGGLLVGTLEQYGVDSATLVDAGYTGTMLDEDGNSYKWVKIGAQVWMAENLKTTFYADGSAIPLVEGISGWDSLEYTDQAYCYYNDSSSYGDTYGALYTWGAAMNGAAGNSALPGQIQGVCPDGWHLPDDADWKQILMTLGMSLYEAELDEYQRGTNEASKLAGNADLWNGYAKIEMNTAFGASGFMALPGGNRKADGTFLRYGFMDPLGWIASFWSATENSSSDGACIDLTDHSPSVRGFNIGKNHGLSVRCLKD